MPKIGLRNIKTCIAIFICAITYVVLMLISKDFADSWYTPFFAGLATTYSIHQDKEKSFLQAKNRALASIVGGFFGMLIVLIFETCANNIWSNIDTPLPLTIRYIFVSLAAVILIYFTVVVKKPGITFIAVLTYLSVSIGAREGLSNFQFGLNRVISTIYGVGVALAVNMFHIPHYKNKKNMYIISVDSLIKKDVDKLSGYASYKLNNLIDRGANIFLYTTRTPGSFCPALENIKFNLPVFLMNGTAVYDFRLKKYLYVEYMDDETAKSVIELVEKNNSNPFVSIIKDDLLYVYHKKDTNEAEEQYSVMRKNSAYCTFNVDIAPKSAITYIVAINETHIINKMVEDINNGPLKDKVITITYDFIGVIGYKFLKFYNKSLLDMKSIEEMKTRYNLTNVLTIGSEDFDSDLLSKKYKNLFLGQNINTSDKEKKNNFERALKLINKSFHKKQK